MKGRIMPKHRTRIEGSSATGFYIQPSKHDTKETWKDWLSPDEPEPEILLTRQEIVDRANKIIAAPPLKPVKPSDLQLWEKIGVLPRGIRRRRGDAQYALYPEWHAYMIRQVRQLQREGYSLDEIKPRIRAYARMALGHGRTPVDEEIGTRPTIQSPEDITMWPVLTEELERLSRWWAHLQGVDVERVEVHVVGKNGRATRYPWQISGHGEEKET
jgi:DNA-binding transcriptional MerR regulator